MTIDLFVGCGYKFEKVVRYSVDKRTCDKNILAEKDIAPRFGLTEAAVESLFRAGYLEKSPAKMYGVGSVTDAIVKSVSSAASPSGTPKEGGLSSISAWEDSIAACLELCGATSDIGVPGAAKTAASVVVRWIMRDIVASLQTGNSVYTPVGDVVAVKRGERLVFSRMLGTRKVCGARMDVALRRNVPAIKDIFKQTTQCEV